MAFWNWEEKVISNDKGKRLVHYYLKDGFGKKVLAVVGKEKSLRHMSYAMTNQFSMMLMVSSPSSALDFGSRRLRWKSRRDLIDWLDSIVSDSGPSTSLPMGDRFSDDEGAEPTAVPTSKGLSSGKLGYISKEFSWLGSAWDCRKKQKHYRSFCRNGVTISVHDFVYVMGEEYKRLVAYIEDLFEDPKANKMVTVRWFHKADEVGTVLPPDTNDKEIFFSLSHQDFSIECIDGLAAVLSVQDFDKFQNEAKHKFSSWVPHMCRRLIDNDDVKPFDITKVQGYWSQELLRSMYATVGTSLKLRFKIANHGSTKSSPNGDEHGEIKGGKGAVEDLNKSTRGERHARTNSAPPLLRKELLKQKIMQQQKHLAPGCNVEVLSQDSGIRGCWFRCIVLKRHHDKVKVRYPDLKDADESGSLEEWVLASRISSPDKLGIRLGGRPVVRPDPTDGSKVPCSLDVGAVVDAWWHNGWWEGIVIRKELVGKVQIYFPGEQRVHVFDLGELRHSQEWVGNKWILMKDRQDVVSSMLSDIGRDNRMDFPNNKDVPVEASKTQVEVSTLHQSVQSEEEALVSHLDGWNWNSSRKRRHVREFGKGSSRRTRQCVGGGRSSSSRVELGGSSNNACDKFLLHKTLTVVDRHENCKVGRSDPVLVAPMDICSSLVMSR